MSVADATEVHNHWYWRPGWRVGTRFYTWHITFEDQTEVVDLAAQYRDRLSRQPELDLIPPRWLHLTMQGIGFVDQVDAADVEAIVAAARTDAPSCRRWTSPSGTHTSIPSRSRSPCSLRSLYASCELRSERRSPTSGVRTVCLSRRSPTTRT